MNYKQSIQVLNSLSSVQLPPTVVTPIHTPPNNPPLGHFHAGKTSTAP